MSEKSTKQSEERSEKAVQVGEKEGELQKIQESRSQPGDKEASSSGSMLPRAASMSFSIDPENSGSEESAEEEFTLLPLPPHLVPVCFDDLEDALLSPVLQVTYQTGNSSVRNRDNSDDSSEKQDTNRDYSSEDFSLDEDANDAYHREHALLQEEIMLTGGSHLPNVQMKLEHSYTSATEKRGRAVEVKEEREEEHKEREAGSQWEDQEVPPAGPTLDGGDILSTSSDPGNDESEGSSDEEFFVTPLSPSSAPEQLEDGDCMHSRLPPGYHTRSKTKSQLPPKVKPKKFACCIFPCGRDLCTLC